MNLQGKLLSIAHLSRGLTGLWPSPTGITETHPYPVSPLSHWSLSQVNNNNNNKKNSWCGCSHCPKQQCENKLRLHTALRGHGSGTNSWSLLCERSCKFQWNHPDHQPLAQLLRVVDFLEHQLARDGRLCAMYFWRTTLKCWNHLLHHLVKEDISELRVEEGTKLKRDLRRKEGSISQQLRVHSVFSRVSPHSQKHEATG